MRIPGCQRREGGGCRLFLPLLMALALWPAGGFAQAREAPVSGFPEFSDLFSGDQQAPNQGDQSPQAAKPAKAGGEQPSAEKGEGTTPSPANPQPQRILGIMPNFRAVSAGVIPPPPSPRVALIISTKNSFDYSSFIFEGITTLWAEGFGTHSQLGKGLPGFARYYWRGEATKTTGNYLAIFALPTLFHQDARYYSLGRGSTLHRIFYSASRVAIAPDYHGHPSFNVSQLLGRGLAQSISLTYYPSQTRTFQGFASKYGYAIGREALVNIFREFWPDIAAHARRHS